MINDFWNEVEHFQTREGTFKERDYIFNNHADIEKRPYLWHKKESLHYTVIFGRFACRVCSKILGIGSAERSWGDVKTLKNNKRSHLSGERVKKQATIFGASCIELAKYQRGIETSSDVSSTPLKFWRDDDFNLKMEEDIVNEDMVNEESDLESTTSSVITERNATQRIFKAYIEDWEKQAIRKQDDLNEAKLLKKYGGLWWRDPDTGDKLLYADNNLLYWTRVTKSGGRYCVHARGSKWKKCKKEKDEIDTEPWCINNDLIGCIAEYYKTNTNLGVIVETRKDPPTAQQTTPNEPNTKKPPENKKNAAKPTANKQSVGNLDDASNTTSDTDEN